MNINSISLSSIFKESTVSHSASQKVILAIAAIAVIAFLIFAAIYTIVRSFNFKANQVLPEEKNNPPVPSDKTPPPVPEQPSQNAPIKEDPKINVAKKTVEMPPPGFENYGNSCWFASGLQILLANPSFEQVVRGPLKNKKLERNGRGFSYRDLTSDELEKRKKIQNALIEL